MVHFSKEGILKVCHARVSCSVFLYNSDMLIPNLPHAKLYFSFPFLKLKNKMAAKIADKVTLIIMIIHDVWVYSGHTNLTFVFNIIILF